MTIRAIPRALVLVLLALLPLHAADNLDEQLLSAAAKGNVEAVKALLDKGADVNAKSPYGVTPLWLSARRGHTAVVKLLLERGADPNARENVNRSTPLGWAAWKGHVEVVKLLLDRGAEGTEDVLNTGVYRNNSELVRLALAKGGLNLEALSDALAVALRNNRTEIVELLRKAGAVSPPQVEVTIPSEVLEAYVGEYNSDKGYEFTLSVKDGKLMAFAPFGEEFALEATDQITFRVPEYGSKLVFQLENGRVVGFLEKSRSGVGVLYKKGPGR